MAKRSFLKLLLFVRQGKMTYVFIVLILFLVVGGIIPRNLGPEVEILPTYGTSFTERLKLELVDPRQQISRLHDLWQKFMVMDTLSDKLQHPLDPVDDGRLRSPAMQQNGNVKHKVDVGFDRYIYFTEILKLSNVSDKDLEYFFSDVSKSATYWALGKTATLNIVDPSFFQDDREIATTTIQLNHIQQDSILNLKIPVADDVYQYLLNESDHNVYVKLSVHPFHLKSYLTGYRKFSSASQFRYSSKIAEPECLTDSAGIDFNTPVRQVVIPGKKKYAAVIVSYEDKIQGNSMLSVTNADSTSTYLGVHHPDYPIMVAAINQRQSLLVNVVSADAGVTFRFSVTAVTGNRYNDLKEFLKWFVKNELQKLKVDGIPVSEPKMITIAMWLVKELEFQLTDDEIAALKASIVEEHTSLENQKENVD